MGISFGLLACQIVCIFVRMWLCVWSPYTNGPIQLPYNGVLSQFQGSKVSLQSNGSEEEYNFERGQQIPLGLNIYGQKTNIHIFVSIRYEYLWGTHPPIFMCGISENTYLYFWHSTLGEKNVLWQMYKYIQCMTSKHANEYGCRGRNLGATSLTLSVK